MVSGLSILSLILPLIIMGILFFVFWIIMLVDAASRKFKNDSDKIVWILVIVLVGIIGALIYYFVVYFGDKTKSMKWFWITLLIIFGVWVLLIILIAVLGSLINAPSCFGGVCAK